MANRISRSQTFIDTNPTFRLMTAARPANLPRGQRTIVFECLSAVHPRCLSLDEMVEDCTRNRRYLHTTKAERNIHRSILYHLNLMDAVERC